MIKFRAWDKETNKYFEPTYQAYMGRLEELTIGLSGRLQKRTYRGVVDESVFPGRYVVEQFTGLTDVNGKEIYEGDIIVSKPTEPKYEPLKIGLVKRSKARAGWCYETAAATGEYNIWTSGKYRTYEVIGNVHANPELLKG